MSIANNCTYCNKRRECMAQVIRGGPLLKSRCERGGLPRINLRARVVEHIEAHGPSTSVQLSEALDVSLRRIIDAVEGLREAGRITGLMPAGKRNQVYALVR